MTRLDALRGLLALSEAKVTMNAAPWTAAPGERAVDVDYVEDDRERKPTYDELVDANERLALIIQRQAGEIAALREKTA